MQLILCHKNLLLKFLSNFFIVSLLRNHNSNLYSDHNNKINVLPQYAVPPYCSNFPELQQSKQSSNFRCLCSILFNLSRTKAKLAVSLNKISMVLPHSALKFVLVSTKTFLTCTKREQACTAKGLHALDHFTYV